MAALAYYLHPVTATSVTAPTALQTKERVVAQIEGCASATSATIVHNFGLSAAELAAGAPITNIEPRQTGANLGFETQVLATVQATNSTTFAVASATGSATAAIVTLRRPHTIGH